MDGCIKSSWSVSYPFSESCVWSSIGKAGYPHDHPHDEGGHAYDLPDVFMLLTRFVIRRVPIRALLGVTFI